MSQREYLVTHGCGGHLGRFRAAGAGDLGRGTAVVVRTLRGLELGEVLRPSDPGQITLPDPFIGELIRPATRDDFVVADRCRQLADRLFDEASRVADSLHLP